VLFYYSHIFKLKEERNCYSIETIKSLLYEAGYEDLVVSTYRFDIRLNSWLNDNTITDITRKLLYDLHVNASPEFKEAYRMERMPDDDFKLSCKMAMVCGKESLRLEQGIR